MVLSSKSLVVWKLTHNKIFVELRIKSRGISLASVSYLCNLAEESSAHLFFQCKFSRSLWTWLNRKTGNHDIFSSLDSCFLFGKNYRNSQVGLVMKVTVIVIIN